MRRFSTPNQEQQIEYLKQKGAHIDTFESLTICTYITTIRGKEYPAAVIFRGKSKKPLLEGYFSQGWEVFANRILDIKEAELDQIERDRKYQAEKKARYEKACAEIKVGDIYYNSWGYEQTNVDFYLVTGRPSKCFVELTPIGMTTVGEPTSWCSDRVIANPDAKIGDPERRKINAYGGISLGRHYSASKWDGRPTHRSWGY